MAYLGFDIGGTKCAVVLGDLRDGSVEIFDKKAFLTPTPWRQAVQALFDAADELLLSRSMRYEEIRSIGFSCGGPLDAEKGLVLSPPNLPGWDRVPLTELAKEKFGRPAFLENDANACALAEWRYGGGRGAKNMVFLTFGTGLGAGIILDNRLIRGASGNAGEVGHIRVAPFGPAGYGKEGSFEGFCSGGGIAQLGATLARRDVQRGIQPGFLHNDDYEAITAKALSDAARAGDPTAAEVFSVCAQYLGAGVSVLVDILNPERIVIGSIYARCEDLLAEGMRQVMQRECLDGSLRAVQVVPAALGERIGDCAALCVAEYGVLPG